MEYHHCIIEDLLVKHFLDRNAEEQLIVAANGRPCPDIPTLSSTTQKGKKGDYGCQFLVSQYTLIPWLAGCSEQKKLFCWPCLLFSRNIEIWTKTGFADFGNLNAAQHRHEKTEAHLKAFLKWKLFGKQASNVEDSRGKVDVKQHNEQVKRNREVLKRAVDAISFLTKQGIPLRHRDEEEEEERDSLNRGNYIELLEMLRTYDPILDSHLQIENSFLLASTSIQDDILAALSEVILDDIKKDVMSATFVSLMFYEVSDVICRPQISTVLRFLKDGEVRECFVGFTDVSSSRTADGLFRHVDNVVKEYQIENTFVAQTFDGAVVKGVHLHQLQAKILEAYPKALFTDSHTHVLNLLLQQSLWNIKECRIFFALLTGISRFFSKSLDRKVALEDFLVWKQPWISPTKWDFNSGLVHTVKAYRNELKEFFENILENPEEWDGDTIVQSMGILSFFDEFRTSFLLEVVSKLFSYMDELYELLQNVRLDVIFCARKVIDILMQLQNDREYGFDTHWSAVNIKEEQSEDTEPSQKRARLSGDIDVYRQLFYAIIDNIVQQIETRYGTLSKLQFLQLLSHEHFNNYQSVFPLDALEALKVVHESLFGFPKLKNELKVLYSSEEFQGLPLPELLKYIRSNDLSCAFKEVYKLAELIMTIPCKTSSSQSSISALDRITSYLNIIQEEDPPNNLCIVGIEKALLQELRFKDSFYDRITEKLISKQKRDELIYL